MHRNLLQVIFSAPVAVALAVVSVGMTLMVAIHTVSQGRVASDAPLELIAALALAAVAVSEASRPARRERRRRQIDAARLSDREP